MHPLSTLKPEDVLPLRGLCFDLDDTLLDHGKLGEATYSALFRLKEAGFELYAVTGRPASWGPMMVRIWPLNGMVTENGRIAFFSKGHEVATLDLTATARREARRHELPALVAELRRCFPELAPSQDCHSRWTDFTFDIGEREHVPKERVQEVERTARALGAKTSVSSVHLHVSLDPGDKAQGTVSLLRHCTGQDPSAIVCRYAFVGDSENDATCFAAFHLTFAVANLTGSPTLAPRFQAQQARGAGFVEIAHALLELRRNSLG